MKKFILICIDLLLFISFLYCQTYSVVGKPKGGILNSTEKEYSSFILSYSHDYKNPQWVMWVLDYDKIMNNNISRKDVENFFEEPSLNTAKPQDFLNSYDNIKEIIPINVIQKNFAKTIYQIDKGHICPFDDNAYDKKAATDCFSMANMSPQYHNFNNGIWKNIEQMTSDKIANNIKFIYGYNTYVYVVAGPILNKLPNQFPRIGKNKDVVIPEYFYKIYLIQKPDNTYITVSWILKNSTSLISASSDKDYRVSINEIEKETGLIMFDNLPENIKSNIKSIVNIDF